MGKLPTNINGYIEGYYGQLLRWSERYMILKKLSDCKFNTYFYCPKEDTKHRKNWRSPYTKKWISKFKNFCQKAKIVNLYILAGISPGLDFDFKKKNEEFKILFNKAKTFKLNGATQIVLMFDDIIPQLQDDNSYSKSEGELHAELANNLSEALNETIFVVPRVYSDELIENECSYLEDFCKTLRDDIPIFYCGREIVSRTNDIIETKKIKEFTANRIILWDNIFANDYSPKRVFLGPYFGRSHFNDTMINPTGLIQTDLFILDLINFTQKNDMLLGWNSTLKKYKIPKEFDVIAKYFFPNIFKFKNDYEFSYDKRIEALDFLIWKWKTSLSREWYKYMLILKQDLQLLNGELNKKRIKKIFPIPLSKFLLKINRRK